MKKAICIILLLIICSVFFVACNKNTDKTSSVDYNLQLVNDGLILVKANGLYGFIDINNDEKIECVYDYATPFVDGVAIVKLDNKYYLIDKNGKRLNKSGYNALWRDEEEKIYIFGSNSKYGLMRNDGSIIKEALYDDIDDFSDGLAWVEINDKYGYIDATGKQIIPIIYNNAYRFENGLACVKYQNKYGFINKKGGTVIDFVYDGSDGFIGEYAWVKIKNTEKIIDKNGKVVYTAAQNERICAWWSNYIFFVYDEDKDNFKMKKMPKENETSQTLLTCSNYEELDESCSLILIYNEDISFSIYNYKGQELAKNINFEKVFDKDSHYYYYDLEIIYDYYSDVCYTFIDNYNIYMYKLENGKMTKIPQIETNYELIEAFGDYFVCWDENISKYGVIDKEGSTILDAVYDEIKYVTDDGYIVYGSNGIYGVKDINGKTIIKPQYDDIYVYYKE